MANNIVPRFKSFIWAGYECTYALSENGRRLDLLKATRHDEFVNSDYDLLDSLNIKTVREGFSWNQIDSRFGVYDFSRFKPILKAGKKYNIQQIWDLNHFDFPTGIDPLSESFVDRFALYAGAAVKEIRKYQKGTIYIVPINEISFFSWIGADMGWWAPYYHGSKNGFKFKTQLVRASIAAMDMIISIDKDVRFIHPDPLMRRIPKNESDKVSSVQAKEFNEIIRYEAWDMLSGKTYPEIGGDPKYLDIVGINYYIHNQEWVYRDKPGKKKLSYKQIDWDDKARINFSEMVQEVYDRYNKPIVVSETGSFDQHREKWWSRTLTEIDESIKSDLPLFGVCVYPTLDRPDSAGFLLPHSGIWDFKVDEETCERFPYKKIHHTIKKFNKKWNNYSNL
jgi:beta-glucosidase/6-phospho-beta-glucosidase/beta-galactosidase